MVTMSLLSQSPARLSHWLNPTLPLTKVAHRAHSQVRRTGWETVETGTQMD